MSKQISENYKEMAIDYQISDEKNNSSKLHQFYFENDENKSRLDESSDKNSKLERKYEEKYVNAGNEDKENYYQEQELKKLSNNLNNISNDDINEDSILWNKKYLIENRKETVERQDAKSKDDISNGAASYNTVDNLWPSKNKGFRHSNQRLKKTISNANNNDYSMT